ncbi:uncharacterized protein LOC131671225 [Phymastichus coffea]|uniref:uncharacterized protein LOC131671225 n=1 Tax=Phymastichus coffea TaxID=108790 RepID=UPI00273B7B72|nr:uncharacterized protein LOC131671225 [Phymastichus coffea]
MSDPETLTSENLLNSPTSNQKVNKRRSSVFKRQSLVSKDQDLEITNLTEEASHESKKFKTHNKHEQQEIFNIKVYIDNLKKEDKSWRDEYLKRKYQVQELLKRDKNHEFIQTINNICLSDSERAFLSMKPDYDEFNNNLLQLHALATKVVYFNLCSENFRYKSSLKLQNDFDDAKYRIINLAD